MIKLTFYPLGNADTCLIYLENNKKILIDYAHCVSAEDDCDPKIDLSKTLREDIQKTTKSEFDVVVFTHADEDHIRGASDFFYLEHAEKYQSDDRIRIREMWVPAAMILEEGVANDAWALRQEARFRLKKGQGIRVFSRPELLESWLVEQGLSLQARKALITDAGSIVPGFSTSVDGVEFFVHSPFAHRDGEQLQDRNSGSIFLHATFTVAGNQTKALLGADTPHEVLAEIVEITRAHKREDRLEWDIYKLPHHCSYLSLSAEKGEDKTIPVPNVQWLFEKGRQGGIIISTSNPIPDDDENDLPPHRQAANYHREHAELINGEFIVTMEHPTEASPKPLEICIDAFGGKVKKSIVAGAAALVSKPAPRAG